MSSLGPMTRRRSCGTRPAARKNPGPSRGTPPRSMAGPERRRPVVLTGAWDNKAILWDAAQRQAAPDLRRTHRSQQRGPERRRQGTLTGSMDGTAILWECPKTRRSSQRFVGHTAPVEKAALSGDGKLVLTGSQDKTAILWDRRQRQKAPDLSGAHPQCLEAWP